MTQICYRCGRSVAHGSGRFVNRIRNLDDVEYRLDEGEPFPEGDWLCLPCHEDPPTVPDRWFLTYPFMAYTADGHVHTVKDLDLEIAVTHDQVHVFWDVLKRLSDRLEELGFMPTPPDHMHQLWTVEALRRRVAAWLWTQEQDKH